MKLDFKSTEFNRLISKKNLFELGYFSFREVDDIDEDYILSRSFSKELWTSSEVLMFIEQKIPAELKEALECNKSRTYKKVCSESIEFHMHKTEYSKRKFKYPNFLNYYRLVNLLINNKEEFQYLFLEDESSTSKNMLSTFDQNLKKIHSNTKILGKKKILKTDISNFYPSIYTHTIPWVFEGKENAKKNRSGGFYNDLDSEIQNMQHGETKGIPIGTLASRVVAEMYLLKIDKEMDLGKTYPYTRYSDDYKFFIDNEAEAKQVLRRMHDVYFKYELTVNESKVKLISYPEIDNVSHLLKSYETNFMNSIDKNVRVIEKNIIEFCNYYLSITSDKSSPLFYFMLSDFFRALKKYDQDKFARLLKGTNAFIHVTNVFLYEMKYSEYYLQLLEEMKLIGEKEVQNQLNRLEENFNSKLKELIELKLSHELMLLLNLNILSNYAFKLQKEFLQVVLQNFDSFNALMSVKILCDNHNMNLFSLKKNINKRLDTTYRVVISNHVECFKSNDFLFEYEITRLCKKKGSNHINFSNSILSNKLYNGYHIKSDDLYFKIYHEMLMKDVEIFKW